MAFTDFKPAVDFIVNLLIDIKKDDIYDSLENRRKIKQILDKDIKNIDRAFFDIKNDEILDLIKEFLIGSIFIDKSFYYPIELTTEQEDKAWEMFHKRIITSTGEKYIKNDYKNKIIKCINLHNEAITNILLSYDSTLQMMVMQRNHKSIEQELNNIFGALNTKTRVQDNDDELDFEVLQLESIMKSYMCDIKKLRNQQIFIFLCLTVIIFTTSIVATHFINYKDNIISEISIYIIIMLFITVAVFELHRILNKLNHLEDIFEKNRYSLFDIHLKCYNKTLEEKFEKSIIDDFHK